jgi:hypothetical protein
MVNYFDEQPNLRRWRKYLQEVAQSVGMTPNEMKVTSSSPPPPSCADMSKKKKKDKGNISV